MLSAFLSGVYSSNKDVAVLQCFWALDGREGATAGHMIKDKEFHDCCERRFLRGEARRV